MDGGFTNNNPADIMKKRGSKRIIMVNVGIKVSMIIIYVSYNHMLN